MVLNLARGAQNILDKFRSLDFLAPLALRLYLVPVFWTAGNFKLADFQNTVDWFGNPEWGLGLPLPWLMAALATATEIGGAVLLLLGLGVRWISIPLMFTMLVAMFSVHWKNGWQAIADRMAPFPPENIDTTIEKLNAARNLLKEHGDYAWLTESGNFVISNNGIEWAATYFIMLLALFFIGAGRYISLDYYIKRWLK